MKLRESGMPEETYWESLFDVRTILDWLGFDATLKDVVELGCGYGTFTLPIAQRIAGTITTTDIDPDMVDRTVRRVSDAGLSNVICRVADVLEDGFGVAPESQDACLLFNILHCEDPVGLLTEGAKTVRPGGAVFVIHWRHDPTTPRGPSMAIRPKPESITAWAKETQLLQRFGEVLDLPPWHYGIRFIRH
ncbi:MAG TPA: class I SAM-dependent methyltransferase [Candidatus Hydrogenedentes bacterium]|nr:class I SAM-dependent methyltransferase [Candidatus Hydrogenedentota bacterium]HRK33390.1 class I SAM-dependent methyltransferase [Candidatus Hydrogenedentota bacterium]